MTEHWRAPSSGYDRALASSGYDRALASSGYDRALASSGYDRALASSGYDRALASSGYDRALASSGYDRVLASSGYDRALASSGYDRALASSGYDRALASSGYVARIVVMLLEQFSTQLMNRLISFWLHHLLRTMRFWNWRFMFKPSRTSGAVQMVRIRNPWGDSHEWKGAWSDGWDRWWNFVIISFIELVTRWMIEL